MSLFILDVTDQNLIRHLNRCLFFAIVWQNIGLSKNSQGIKNVTF
jgi:hypothetical protein